MWTSSSSSSSAFTMEQQHFSTVPSCITKRFLSTTDENPTTTITTTNATEEPPLYITEGLFAVHKPLGWTSQQVVGKVRWILEKDAKMRKVPDKRKKRRRPWTKVGHGGTLDPLASGVLVIGVGKGAYG